jgi:hypothetical protein
MTLVEFIFIDCANAFNYCLRRGWDMQKSGSNLSKRKVNSGFGALKVQNMVKIKKHR